ncbi:sce7725 family protein [Curtobacterium sp. MCBA15_012]|uniref:sce7725 family protein n=1 Tax=Curtobacterium sp. MCBA15_012 TaxID=1898738 RepID=UPI001113C48A|nr:sce7725 family protein [Curtobacterium sp. MCBA15_012]WIB00317.1 sce7725 family protein [Curtobacterium sp. MCBA15_012]
MYVPYLYGRQEELRALADLAPGLAQHGRVIPMIEPTENRSLLHSKIAESRGVGAEMMIVANPTRGDLANPAAAAAVLTSLAPDLADAAHVRPVFRESPGQGIPELAVFLTQYPNRPVGIVLTSNAIAPAALATALASSDYLVFFAPEMDPAPYNASIPAGRSIVISNNFPGRTRNIDYTATLDEYFSDELITWRGAGWAGFSDFTVLPPESFASSGGPALALAIHLSYMDGQQMRVRHFVSGAGARGQNAPKWAVVLPDLQAVVSTNPTMFEDTAGLRAFLGQAGGAYTSPGTSKRQQIGHHVEGVAANMTP